MNLYKANDTINRKIMTRSAKDRCHGWRWHCPELTNCAMERIAVVLHLKSREAGQTVKKLWRFSKKNLEEYTRAGVQSELVQLFPNIQRHGLQFELWHKDDFAGNVSRLIVDYKCIIYY